MPDGYLELLLREQGRILIQKAGSRLCKKGNKTWKAITVFEIYRSPESVGCIYRHNPDRKRVDAGLWKRGREKSADLKCGWGGNEYIEAVGALGRVRGEDRTIGGTLWRVDSFHGSSE